MCLVGYGRIESLRDGSQVPTRGRNSVSDGGTGAAREKEAPRTDLGLREAPLPHPGCQPDTNQAPEQLRALCLPSPTQRRPPQIRLDSLSGVIHIPPGRAVHQPAPTLASQGQAGWGTGRQRYRPTDGPRERAQLSAPPLSSQSTWYSSTWARSPRFSPRGGRGKHPPRARCVARGQRV